MLQTPETFAAAVFELARLCQARDRDPASVERTALVPRPDRADIDEWERSGATRLIVAPWARTADAIEGLEQFAGLAGFADGAITTRA